MTSYFNDDRRHQIEQWLGRPLAVEELRDVLSLDKLSPAQLSVLDVLARRQRLTALIYLRGVVRDVIGDDALALIDRIRESATYPP
jgi:hypothetical protein